MTIRVLLLAVSVLLSNTAWGQFGPRPEDETSAGTTSQSAAAPATGSPRSAYAGPKLRLVIPVFDPGLPNDPNRYEEMGIWPELRRAEAVRAAVQLQRELQRTGIFESVQVMPDTTASADLYVMGSILESNGEDYGLAVEIYDATGNRWLKKRKFRHRVSEAWVRETNTSALDPYSPIYPMISAVVVEQLVREGKKHQDIEKRNEAFRARGKDNRVKMSSLQRLIVTREVMFARSIAPDLYRDAATVDKRDRVKLNYLPSSDDPNWQRVEAVMDADSQFNDVVSASYGQFVDRMDQPYQTWQRDAYPLAKEYREAKNRANTQAVLGVLGAIAGAAVAGSSNNSATQAAGVAAAVAGAAAIATSFRTRAESRQQAALLSELGASVQSVVAPMVIEMTSRQFELRGTAAEQVAEWRGVLREIYNDTELDPGAITILQPSSEGTPALDSDGTPEAQPGNHEPETTSTVAGPKRTAFAVR
jgi:hypothetical protein